MLGDDQAGVDELGPSRPVDGGPEPDGEGVGDDGPRDVAGLGDDGDRMAVGRIDGSRSEAVLVGGLEEHLDRCVGPRPEMSCEPR